MSLTIPAYVQSYHMDICETLSSIRAPMSQQSSLDMVECEWLTEKRVSPEVNHAQTHVE